MGDQVTVQGATFTLSRRGIRALWASDAVGDYLTQAAGEVNGSVRRARRDLNVSVGRRKGAPEAGDTALDDQGVRYATIVVTDPGWHLAEYGTATSPAHRPIQTGVERSGAKWKDPGL